MNYDPVDYLLKLLQEELNKVSVFETTEQLLAHVERAKELRNDLEREIKHRHAMTT